MLLLMPQANQIPFLGSWAELYFPSQQLLMLILIP